MGDTQVSATREQEIRQLTITTAMSYSQSRTVYDMAARMFGPRRALDVAGRVADACEMGLSLVGPIATLAAIIEPIPTKPGSHVHDISPAETLRITERFACLVYDAAYAAGARAAIRAGVAVDHDKLHSEVEQRVSAELAQMRANAAAMHAQLGHPYGYRYVGGPLDWDSGLPKDSVCAWRRCKVEYTTREATADRLTKLTDTEAGVYDAPR